MPTKTTKPRREHHPAGYRPTELFSQDQTGSLGALIGLTDGESLRDLYGRLNDPSSPVWLSRYVEENETTPGEIRAALREVSVGLDRLLQPIDGIDSYTKHMISQGYQLFQTPAEPGRANSLEHDLEALRRLRDVARTCLTQTRIAKGRRPTGWLRVAAVWLAGIYEEFTGSEFRASRSLKRGRPAGPFLREALLIMKPRIPTQQLQTLSRYALKDLRARKTMAPPI
jgi:hypothetical protein